MTIEISECPTLSQLVQLQIDVAPNQERFLTRRLDGLDSSQKANLERIATNVAKLIEGEERQHAVDYAWLCEEQVEEELYFRRNGKYRLTTFEEALREVYDNKEYMTRYMNGLLMTQLWWSNHTSVMSYYENEYLPGNKEGYNYLEIGPGHGLFVYLAANDPRAGEVVGWDISEASIAMTQEALRKLGSGKMPDLIMQDMFDEPQGNFDSVVFSEVLEHMEEPREALKVLRSVLSDDGRLFVNMPINSPAPDHLFNSESPEELRKFIEDVGLKVVEERFFPATNQTLDKARKRQLTINCVFVCQKA